MPKKAGRAGATLLPGWYDVYSRGTRADDHETQAAAVTTALEEGHLTEYEVLDPDHGSQGFALMAQVKSARTTRLGTSFSGAHVAASDGDFDRYMAGQEEGTVLYHRCAEWPCHSTTKSGEVLHLPKFRVVKMVPQTNVSIQS